MKTAMNKNNLKNSSRVLLSMLCGLLIVSMLADTVDARLRQNKAVLKVSCDDSAMTVQMTFRHPFRGVVFIPEHYYDPTCSYGVPPTSRSLEITLILPHDSCKMRIKRTRNKLLGVNTIAVFHHRMLETVYDYIQNVTCELKNPIKDLNKNMWTEPLLKTWISFQNPYSILPEHVVDKMEVDDSLLLVYHVKDQGLYKDMMVMNCFGHDDRTVNHRTSFYQISGPFGCSSESDLISNFTTFRDSLSSPTMMAYAIVRNFSRVVRRRIFITCGARICEDECERNCEGTDLESGFYLSDIVTKGLANRQEGSKRPASLTAFERFDRQRRSHDDAVSVSQYTTDEQNKFLLEKLKTVSPYSVNQTDVATEQIDQNGTTPIFQDFEEHDRSKRAIKQFANDLISRMNVFVIKSDETVASKHSRVMAEEKGIMKAKNNESFLAESSNLHGLDSVVKVKMPIDQKPSRIDGQLTPERFNFRSFLRALVAIFALFCICAVCYFMFSSKKNSNVGFASDYATQVYL